MANFGEQIGNAFERGGQEGADQAVKSFFRQGARDQAAAAKEKKEKEKAFLQNMKDVGAFVDVIKLKEGEVGTSGELLDTPEIRKRFINEMTRFFLNRTADGKISARAKAEIEFFADKEIGELKAFAAAAASSAGKGTFNMRTYLNVLNSGRPGAGDAYLENTVLADVRKASQEASKASASLAETREADIKARQPGIIAKDQAQAARSRAETNLAQARLSGQQGVTDALGKSAGAIVDEARGKAASARTQRQAIGALRAAVHSKKFPPGPFGRGRAFISGTLQLLGVDPSGFPLLGKPATAEVIDGAGAILATEMARNFKGRIQNRQTLELLIRAVPGLSKTEEGNIILADLMDRRAQQDERKSKALNRLIADGKATAKNIFASAAKVEKIFPIVDPATLDRIKRISKVPKAPVSEKGSTFIQFDDAAGSIAGTPGSPLFVRPNGSIFKVVDDGK